MSILITGASGLIGSALAQKFKYNSHPHIGIDPNSHQRDVLPLTSLHKDQLEELFHIHRFKTVIHLGMTSTDREARQNESEARQSILTGTEILMDLLKRFDGEHFIFSSSSMVYGDFQTDKVSEEHPCHPIEFYGKLKREAELLIQKKARDTQLNYTIFRPIAVYGPNDQKQRVVSKLYHLAKNKRPLVLSNDQVRLDFTYIDDVIEGISCFINNPKAYNQTFNLSFGKSRTLKELVELIQQYFPSLEVRVTPTNESQAKRGTLDSDRMKSVLGFKPRFSLEEGLSALHEKESL